MEAAVYRGKPSTGLGRPIETVHAALLLGVAALAAACGAQPPPGPVVSQRPTEVEPVVVSAPADVGAARNELHAVTLDPFPGRERVTVGELVDALEVVAQEL